MPTRQTGSTPGGASASSIPGYGTGSRRCSWSPTRRSRPRVATSAGDHVVDPRTGRPATGLASVTVVGPDLAIADAYATATVVLGASVGMRWLATRVGYEGMGITDEHAVLLTPGFDRYRVS